MTQAYSYVRWSSEKQSLGDSERRQFEAAERYAFQNNLTLSNTRYVDAGISAYKGLNAAEGALRTFLDAADAGRIPKGSVLLVESLDRLSRLPVTDALRLFQDIIGRGIEIVTLNDNQRYSLSRINDNWTSLIVALAVMSRATEESKTKSERVRAAWEGKRLRGEILTAISPAWLRLSDDRKRWLVIKEEAEKVQRIFKDALAGVGTPTIARRLNEEGIKPFASETWTNGTVAHVLKNRAVIGTYTPKKTDKSPIEGYYPAIIDEATFWQAQAGLKARKWKGGTTGEQVANLFTGLCFCAQCGSRMRYVSSSKPNMYLHCIKAYSGSGCFSPRIPYGSLKRGGFEREVLLKVLLDLEVPFKNLSEAGTGSERTVIEGNLALKREQLDNLFEFVKGGSKRAVHEATKLEAEIEALEVELRTYTEKPAMQDVVEIAVMYLQALNRAQGDEQHHMRRALRGSLQQLIERIAFLDDLEEEDGAYYRKARITLIGRGEHEVRFRLPEWGINGTRRRTP